MRKLSEASKRLEGQPMFKLLTKVQQLERMGKKIIHFEIGDPDFKTPENIIDAAITSLKKGETHYTSSFGLYDMRMAACETTAKTRGFRPDLDQVLITPGANIIIYYAYRCLLDPEDEVLLPDPGFPTYYSAAKFCDIKVVRIPLRESNNFRMFPKDVEERITSKTKMIVINSPSNPTGSVTTKEEIDEIYDIAKKYDLYLLSDEVYARMIYEEDYSFYSPSIRDKCNERVIVLNGFSKAFAMTGWRLGCVIGPKFVIEKIALLLETTSSCVSPFIQRAGIEAIKGSQDEVKKMVSQYKKRRDLLVKGLNELSGVKCLMPGGAFYVFPNISKTGMSDEEFSDFMLNEAGVALLPGSCFGEHGKKYVRLCYATSMENIVEGLNRMKLALDRRWKK